MTARRFLALIFVALACETKATKTPEPTDDPMSTQIGSQIGNDVAMIDRTPADYVLVGPNGTTAFANPPTSSAEALPPARAAVGTPIASGFGFVATATRTVGGHRFVQIADGRWLPASDLKRARPSTFAGFVIPPGDSLRLGWVTAPETTVRQNPTPTAPAVTTRPAHTCLTFAGPCQTGWCPLAVGWVRKADLAIPTVFPRPARVGPIEPWIDIDLASQTVVAYRGDQPVYATLVSTGIGDSGSPLATPVGIFTIRSKHRLVRMDNLEHTGVVPYAYDVPLAQYFSDGKALHAALWHDRFGRATSHGCVNLTPRDAAWLFAFTTPVLPRGSSEIFATPNRTGTVVRVRGQLPALTLKQ